MRLDHIPKPELQSFTFDQRKEMALYRELER
jgi:hypothetical protein